jgi:NAD(P)-dependent dehydrogenase (short-subunit alcohol dehydrogenase family)
MEAFTVRDGKLRIFSGAVAIVTGGASGIGRALCRALVKLDCEVVVVDLQSEPAEEVVQVIRKDGGKASFIRADVSDFAAMDRAVKTTIQGAGRLDYMFNNAGIGIGLDVRDHTIEDWHRIVDVNLKGVINGIQAAYPIMINQGFGHIVNTSSMGGLKPTPGIVSYAATKAAVFQISRSLRIEAQEYGVRVSVLCPGVIQTPIMYGGTYGKLPAGIAKDKLEQMWELFRPMDPNIFARKALRAVGQNKAVIIVPAWWKIFWYADRASTMLSMAINKRFYRKIKREFC